jgi:osmoprotectant transport system permease protein
MSDALREQLALLPEYLGRHLLLTITALFVGIGISFPLAILVTRVRWLRGPVLAIASAIQTIPSLALLALMVPLLRAIGFLPAVIALTLYSMLPVIRNTVTGIDDVDPNLIEAGRGLGMTPRQLLVKVQIPLAMPVIIAGIRTATVWVVGIATLSTPVGATSLGNFIFSGLQTQNYTAVLVGCGAAAMLALVLDLLIRLMEVASSRRSRMMLAMSVAGVVLVLGGGLAPVLLARSGVDDRPAVVIGAKTFSEQYILAALIAERLDAAGYRARKLESLGSTVVFDALAVGRIDCYVDYTGTIWANHMKREDRASADEVLRAVTEWLRAEHRIECLGRLGFENTYALAMRRDEAERLGVTSIADLFRHAPTMKIGGDYEFFGRPEWDSLTSEYELAFSDTVGMDGTLMYGAVATGEIDVIAAFSTDGRIAANDLVVLENPRSVFPPYDAVLLVGEVSAREASLRTALQPLIGAIDDERMRTANMEVDVQGASVDAVARRLHESIR